MANNKMKAKTDTDEMLPEYDFRKSKRVEKGRTAKAMANGYTIRVMNGDKVVEERFVPPRDPKVTLAPDVLPHFRDSAAVNKALRILIAQKKKGRAQPQKKLSA